MQYTYLLINILAVCLPLVFSFEQRISFYRKWKYLFPAMFITAFIFILWDIWFTSLGVWYFNPKYITGVTIINLPFEEVLFFLAIPYASMFLYEVLIQNVFTSSSKLRYNYLSLLINIILLIIAFFNFNKAYTFSSFFLCGGYIGFLFLRKSKVLHHFFLYFLILTLPFMIVNGILTGSFLDREVVGYNNMENLDIRLLTIPVEDFIYGMLMMLLNVSLYEYFKSRY